MAINRQKEEDNNHSTIYWLLLFSSSEKGVLPVVSKDSLPVLEGWLKKQDKFNVSYL